MFNIFEEDNLSFEERSNRYDEDLQKRIARNDPNYWGNLFTEGYQGTMGVLGYPMGLGSPVMPNLKRGDTPVMRTTDTPNYFSNITTDPVDYDPAKIQAQQDNTAGVNLPEKTKYGLTIPEYARNKAPVTDDTIGLGGFAQNKATLYPDDAVQFGGSSLGEYGSLEFQTGPDGMTRLVNNPNAYDYTLGGLGPRETENIVFTYSDLNAKGRKEFKNLIDNNKPIDLTPDKFRTYLTTTKQNELIKANVMPPSLSGPDIAESITYTGKTGIGGGSIDPSAISNVYNLETGTLKTADVADKLAKSTNASNAMLPYLAQGLMLYGLLSQQPTVAASAPQGGGGTQVAVPNLYDRERYKYGIL